MILPYIMYCVHVWGSAYETHLRHLMILQNNILKSIAGVPPKTNADAIQKLYIYIVGSFMYKYDNICRLNCLCACLPPYKIFMITTQKELQNIMGLLPFMAQLVARNVLGILEHTYGILSSLKWIRIVSPFRNLLMQCSVSDLIF